VKLTAVRLDDSGSPIVGSRPSLTVDKSPFHSLSTDWRNYSAVLHLCNL